MNTSTVTLTDTCSASFMSTTWEEKISTPVFVARPIGLRCSSCYSEQVVHCAFWGMLFSPPFIANLVIQCVDITHSRICSRTMTRNPCYSICLP
jgi:hypothetical protein